jgi:hypothetical protein
MKAEDSEKRIIIRQYDFERTGLDITQHVHLGDYETRVTGFFEKNIRKKLTDHIREEMEKQGAYIAIIKKEIHTHSFLTQTIYRFSMYKMQSSEDEPH